MKIVLKSLFFLFSMITLSACWAPRCPIKSCQSKYEHIHSSQVSGVFSSRLVEFPTIHFLWEKRRDTGVSMKLEGGGSGGRQRNKGKRTKKVKLFPWEK